MILQIPLITKLKPYNLELSNKYDQYAQIYLNILLLASLLYLASKIS